MPHGTGISRQTENKAIRLADKALKWKEAELDAIEKRQEIFELIWDIQGVEGEVLYEKFINLRTWEEVADKVNYTERGIYNVRDRAYAIVEERLKTVHGISCL